MTWSKFVALREAAIVLVFGMVAFAAAAEEPVSGGTLNMVINPEPATLMLAVNGQAPTATVGSKMYEGLVAYGIDQKPKPELAKSWEIDSTGTIYTFHLEESVLWHDGKPFTAEDVVFSFKMNAELNEKARKLVTLTREIKTLNKNTVQVTLKEPYGLFIQTLSVDIVAIVPKHIYENTDYRTNPANDTPVGTGPFKLVEWRRGEFIQLERNNEYWRDGQPYLDRIIYRIIPDAAARSLAFENGEVDLLMQNDVQPIDVPRLAALPNVIFTTTGFERWSPMSMLMFNMRKSPMDDVRFRQAISYALDREFIARAIWSGLAKTATGPITSDFSAFYNPKIRQYEYNLDKARQLLDEMGLMPDADGVRVRLRLAPQPYGETWTRFGEYVRQQLVQIGVDAEIEPNDRASWFQKLSDWDFDMGMTNNYQNGDPANGPQHLYTTDSIVKGSPWNNIMGYSNPKVDELFAKAARSAKQDQRKAFYDEAQTILAEDLPLLWLVEVKFPIIYHNKVQDLVTLSHTPVQSMAGVWLKQN